MKIKVKVNKYNEIAPSEVQKLLDAGGIIEHSPYGIGVCVGWVIEDGVRKKAYSDDWLIINNIRLPLSHDTEYDYEITINVNV